MSFKENNIELFDKAIQGALSPEELEFFNEQLKNPEFKSAYDDFQLINNVILEKGTNELKLSLTTLETDMQEEFHSKPKILKSSRFLILISLALIMVIIWLISVNSNKTNSEEIYFAYYQPYPNTIDPLTKGDSDDNLSAFQLYEQGNHSNSLRLLDKMQINDTTEFYRALNFIALREFNHSTDLLISIKDNSISKFQSDAKWYLALSYIKNGQSKNAFPILIDLSRGDNSYYSQKAGEILQIISD